MRSRRVIALVAALQFTICVGIAAWTGHVESGRVEEMKIEPGQILIGQMERGERRTAYAKLLNPSTKTIYLNEPRTTCGCVQAALDRQQIGPGEQATLRLTVAAGPSPENFSQKVFLSAVEKPEALQSITVTGTVAPEFWTHPETIFGELDETGNVCLDMCILTADGGEIMSASSSSEHVRIEWREGLGNARHVGIHVNSHESGSATLEGVGRTEASERRVVKLPINWRRRPDLRIMPSRFAMYKGDKDKLIVPLFVYGKPTVLDKGVLIDSLFPWVEVTEKTRLNAWTIKVSLVVDQKTAPRDIKNGTAVLALRPTDARSSERVTIVSK